MAALLFIAEDYRPNIYLAASRYIIFNYTLLLR